MATQTGVSSQNISRTDILSEGPVRGLKNGTSSIFFNDVASEDAKIRGYNPIEGTASGKITFDGTSLTNTSMTGASLPTNLANPAETPRQLVLKDYFSTDVSIAETTEQIDNIIIPTGFTCTAVSGTPFTTDWDTIEGFSLTAYLKGNGLLLAGQFTRINSTTGTFSLYGIPSGSVDTSVNYELRVAQSFPIASINSSTSLTLESGRTPAAGTYFFEIPSLSTQEESTFDGIPSKIRGIEVEFRPGHRYQDPLNEIGGVGGSVASTTSVNHELKVIGTGEISGINPVPEDGKIGNTMESGLPLDSRDDVATDATVLNDTAFGITAAQRPEVDEISLRITYPGGLQYINGDNGNRSTSYARYLIQIQTTLEGKNSEWENAFPAEGPYIQHRGRTNAAYSFDHILGLNQYRPFDSFKVRVIRLTRHIGLRVESSGHGNGVTNLEKWTLIAKSKIDQLGYVIKDRLSYPYTSVISTSFSSKQYQEPPKMSYLMQGLKVKVPTSYTPREYSSNGVAQYESFWNGTFKDELQYTDNPAWVFYDIVTNNRYGAGRWIKEADVDKYALYNIAKYCDELVDDGAGSTEPRFRSNIFLTKSTDVYKVLKDFASSFTAMVYWLDGQVTAIQDVSKDPIYTFSKSNVIDGKFSYESSGLKTRSNQIVVTWNDPKSNYEPVPLIVEDREAIVRDKRLIPQEVVAFGCTSEAQAIRFGRWKLWTAQKQTEVVSFKSALNSLYIKPGDIINVQDADRQGAAYSGRVSSATSTSVTLDRTVNLRSGSTYTLSTLVISNGEYSIEENEVTNSSGNTAALTVSGFTNTPSASTIWALKETKDGLPVSGSYKQYRVLSITQDKSNEYGFSAVEHYDEKYTYIDSGYTLASLDSTIYEEVEPRDGETEMPGPSNLRLVIETDARRPGEEFKLEWDASTSDFVESYEIYHNIEETESPIRTSETFARFTNVPNGSIDFNVRAVSVGGNYSPFINLSYVSTDPYGTNIDRVQYGIPKGAITNSEAGITGSAGSESFTFAKSSPILASNGAKEVLLTPDENSQDISDITADENYYVFLDADTPTLKLMYYDRESLVNMPFWRDAGTGNSDVSTSWTSIGSVSIPANSNRVTGTGFNTNVELRDILNLSGSTSVVTNDDGEVIGEGAVVVSIISNTELIIDRTFDTAISSTTAYRANYRPDYEEDAALARVSKNSSDVFTTERFLTVDPNFGASKSVVLDVDTQNLTYDSASSQTNTPSSINATITALGYDEPEFKIVIPAGMSAAGTQDFAVSTESDTLQKSFVLDSDGAVAYNSGSNLTIEASVREKNNPSNTVKTTSFIITKSKDGDPGDDGASINLVFTRSSTTPEATGTGSLPTGTGVTWEDDAGDTTGTDPLWAVKGELDTSNNEWSWGTPYRVDGNAVAEIYFYSDATTGNAPSFSAPTYNFTTNSYTAPANWNKSPPSLTADGQKIWVIVVLYASTPGDTAATADTTSTAAIYAQRTDGDPGDDGASINLVFTRSSTAPEATGTGSLPTGTGVTWVDDAGDTTGTDSLWAVKGQLDTSNNEWSWGTPYRVDGKAIAEIYFYSDATTGNAPSFSAPTYNFLTNSYTAPANWNKSPPSLTADGQKIWVTVVLYASSPKDSAATAYTTSTAAVYAQRTDGDPGDPGDDGQSVKFVQLFKKNDSTFTPGSTATYADPTNGVESGWTTSIPALTADGDKVYMVARTFTSDGLSPQDANWSAPVIISQRTDGLPAISKRFTYDDLQTSGSVNNPGTWKIDTDENHSHLTNGERDWSSNTKSLHLYYQSDLGSSYSHTDYFETIEDGDTIIFTSDLKPNQKAIFTVSSTSHDTTNNVWSFYGTSEMTNGTMLNLLVSDGNRCVFGFSRAAPGLRTVQGYLYYEKTTSGAPSDPGTSTYTFSTGDIDGGSGATEVLGLSDTSAVDKWTNEPRTQDPTSSNTHYTIRYYGTESASNSSTVTVTYSDVVQYTNFSGVVTFSDGTFQEGGTDITTIDGGNIDTGTITANSLSVRTLDLVNPVSTTKNLAGWGGVSETDQTTSTVEEIVSYNSTENAIQITNKSDTPYYNDDTSVSTDSFVVRPDSIYKVAYRVKVDNTTGKFYAGLRYGVSPISGDVMSTENNPAPEGAGQNTEYEVFQRYTPSREIEDISTLKSSAHFIQGIAKTNLGTTEYNEYVHYIIGANRDIRDCPNFVDQNILDGNSVADTNFPYIKVNPLYVGEIERTTGGTGYTVNGTNVSVSGGSGTGLTIDYTVLDGAVEEDSITVNKIGVGYKVGDVLTIPAEDEEDTAATCTITKLRDPSSLVTSITGTHVGSSYGDQVTRTNIATAPHSSNSDAIGTGLTVDYQTNSSGQVILSTLEINNRGGSYKVGDSYVILSGSENARFTISSISDDNANVALRFLHYDNTSASVEKKLYIKDVSVSEISAGQIVADSITTGTLDAGDVTISNLRADDITGGITENYSFADRTAGSPTDIPGGNTPATLLSITLPTPQFNISKHGYIQGTLRLGVADTGQSSTGISVHTLQIFVEKLSRGQGYTNMGTVISAANEGIALYSVTVSGNKTDQIDFFGGVDDDTTGTALGQVEALEYDVTNNRTKIIYNYTSNIFSVGETVFYSPDRGTSAGTYLSRIRKAAICNAVSYGNSTSVSSFTTHISIDVAKSTASETYRLRGLVDRVNTDFTPSETRYVANYTSFVGTIGYRV